MQLCLQVSETPLMGLSAQGGLSALSGLGGVSASSTASQPLWLPDGSQLSPPAQTAAWTAARVLAESVFNTQLWAAVDPDGT